MSTQDSNACFLAVIVFVACCCRTSSGHVGVSMCHNNAGWDLTFEDEFNGLTLNGSNWQARNNMTHGSRETELYMADEAYLDGDGNLVLRTRKRVEHGPSGRTYNITSAWVDSMEKRYQTYGRFEVRARLPTPAAGRAGMWPDAWPAHWMLPNPSSSKPPPYSPYCYPCGSEIDIMEGFHPRGKNNEPLKTGIYMTYHWGHACGTDDWNKHPVAGHYPEFNDTTTTVDWSGEYHTFGVEWNTTTITWFVDGIARHQHTEGQPASLFVPHWDMYMILNTATQPWASATKDSFFPLYHIIDRVTFCEPTSR